MASTERKYDLYGPEFRADPYSVFAQIREREPVLYQAGFDGLTPMWFVTRRLPDLRLAVPREELEWRPTPGFRRLVALPVAW